MATLHDTDAIRTHLRRMSASRVFARAGRMYPLLEYLIDAELAGNGDRISQYKIATDVLGRDERFDPLSDSIVRVEAGRLRNKLREYYESDGREDGIRFELPKGGYRLRIAVDTAERPKITVDAARPRTAKDGAGGTQPARSDAPAAAFPPAAASTWAGPFKRGVPLLELAGLAVVALVGAAGLWREQAIEGVSSGQDDVAAQAAGALSAEHSAGELQGMPTTPVFVPETPSPEAFDLFLRTPTVSSIERIVLLDRALEIDPGYAEAHAMKAYLLSYALINSAFGPAFEIPFEDLGRLVERHAREAAALDGDDVPLAGVAIGSLYLFTWRWTDARRAFERIAAVRPNAGRLLNYAYLDAFSGRTDEALRLMDRLIRHTPDKSTLRSIRGLVLAMAGNLDAAAASLREGISAMEPFSEGQIQSMLIERSWLAAVEIARGDADAALRELRYMENLSVEIRDVELPFMAYAYARLGRHEDAQRLLAELEPAMERGGPFGAGARVLTNLAKGDPDGAHEWLEAGARKASNHEPDEHFFALMLLRANLLADPVLERPEFVDVLSRISGD